MIPPNVIAAVPKVLQGLWVLLQATPAFLQLAKEILKFLHEVENYRERKRRLEETVAAVQKARQDKDTSGLDALFAGEKAAEDGGAQEQNKPE